MIQAVRNKKYLMLVSIAGIIIIVDQATKAAVVHALPLYESVSIIPYFFNLTHIHNPGGAFGFLANYNSHLRDIFFPVASALAIGLIVYLYSNTPRSQPLARTGFSLILGGAASNLIDRIRLGVVVDFLDFYIGNLHWPAFNVADSAISIGIMIFLFNLFFKNSTEAEKQAVSGNIDD
jgi:signal peptidase II